MARRKRFAVVRMWPDRPTAENEVVARLTLAAEKIGAEIVVIDRNGCRLDDSGEEIAAGDVDFVIHLHFETGKVYDAFSYGALYNPVHFFFDWGYSEHAQNQASHDGFLSPGSRWIEDLVLREVGDAVEREDFVPFNTTLPGPVHAPRARDDKTLFYCGVNWERLGRYGGRHQSLLRALDGTGLLSIYGPAELMGKPVWSDFRSYRGPLPFDGRAVVDAIGLHGVALVLTSVAHKLSDIASNRLFESVAAGALVIADRHDFVRETFGDDVLYIDEVASPARAAQQIADHVAWSNDNAEAAAAMVRRAQRAFKSRFSLDDQLAGIFARHAGYAAKRRRRLDNRKATVAVDIVLPWYGGEAGLPDAFVQSLAKVRYRKLHLWVVGEPLGEADQKTLAAALGDRASVHPRPTTRGARRLASGAMIAQIEDRLAGEVLIAANGSERWFQDSVGRLVRAFEDDPGLGAAVGDVVERAIDEDGTEERRYLTMHRGPQIHDATANLAVRRSAYRPLRRYADYLDGGAWRDFLLLACDGPALRKIGHHGLIVDAEVDRALFGSRGALQLDAAQQAALIAHWAARHRPGIDESTMIRMVTSALRLMSDDERADFAAEVMKDLPLTGLQRHVARWLWRPLRKRARKKAAGAETESETGADD